jgi:mannose-1-phosphate guanylyltransferase
VKAFLLAAGHGTRLRPLTDTTPKCLLPVAGVPIISIWLSICRRYGIDEVLVNLHAHTEQLRNYLNQHERTGDVEVILSEESVLLGSAGTLRANAEWIGRDESFWIFYSDVLTNVNLAEMMAFHRSRNTQATIGVYEVDDPRRCGIVTADANGIVQKFVEKPKDPEGNLAFSGVMLASSEILKLVPDKLPADIGFDVLPELIGKMAAFPISSFLLDIGTLQNYNAAQTSWPGLSSVSAS